MTGKVSSGLESSGRGTTKDRVKQVVDPLSILRHSQAWPELLPCYDDE